MIGLSSCRWSSKATIGVRRNVVAVNVRLRISLSLPIPGKDRHLVYVGQLRQLSTQEIFALPLTVVGSGAKVNSKLSVSAKINALRQRYVTAR